MKKHQLLNLAAAGLMTVGGISLLHASSFYAAAECQVDADQATVTTVERKSDATPLLVLVGLLQLGLSAKIICDFVRQGSTSEAEVGTPINLKPKSKAIEPDTPDDVPFAGSYRPAPVSNGMIIPPTIEGTSDELIPDDSELEKGDKEESEAEIDLLTEYQDYDLPRRLARSCGYAHALIGLQGSGKTTLIMEMVKALLENHISDENGILINHWSDCNYLGVSALKLSTTTALTALLDQVQTVYKHLTSGVPVWLFCDDWHQTVAYAEGAIASHEIGAKEVWKEILNKIQEINLRTSGNINMLFASRIPNIKIPREQSRILVLGRKSAGGNGPILSCLKNQHVIKNRQAAADLLTEVEIIEPLAGDHPLILSVLDEYVRILPDLSGNWRNSSQIKSSATKSQETQIDTENVVPLHAKVPTSEFWYQRVREALDSGMAASEVVKQVLKMGGTSYPEGKQLLDQLIANFEGAQA